MRPLSALYGQNKKSIEKEKKEKKKNVSNYFAKFFFLNLKATYCPYT